MIEVDQELAIAEQGSGKMDLVLATVSAAMSNAASRSTDDDSNDILVAPGASRWFWKVASW